MIDFGFFIKRLQSHGYWREIVIFLSGNILISASLLFSEDQWVRDFNFKHIEEKDCVKIMTRGTPPPTEREIRQLARVGAINNYDAVLCGLAQLVLSSTKGWPSYDVPTVPTPSTLSPLWIVATEELHLFGKKTLPALLDLTNANSNFSEIHLEQLAVTLNKVGGDDLIVKIIDRLDFPGNEKNIKVLLSLLRRVAEKRWEKYNEYGDSKKRMTRFMAIELVLRLEHHIKNLPAADISLLPLCGNIVGQFPNIEKNIEPENVRRLFIEWLGGEYWQQVKRAFMESCGTEKEMGALDAVKIAEEKNLMAIVSSWRQDLYDKGKIKKQPIALAIDRLGEMQSMNAIPLLVAMVKFGYYEGEEKRSIGGPTNFPGIFKISPSLRALKNIGTPAVAEIVKRLGQIPDGDDGYLERYLLHQALLHILEREKAVELLNKSAEAATDENVKSRLKISAQTVSHLRISK
jgi:hypothetical protein